MDSDVPPEERPAASNGSSDEDLQEGSSSSFSSDEQMQYEEDDDDEDADDIVVQLLQNPLSHRDSVTMGLTPEERRWAEQLKEIVENRPEIQNMNDMWIAHYAIVSQGDHEDATKRILSIQNFQRTFGVDHSVEQGVHMLSQLIEQQPGLVLSLDVDSVSMEGLHIMDQAKLNPKLALETPQNWKNMIVGSYYYFYAVQPTLATVRAGNYAMSDHGNVDWHTVSMEYIQRFNAELLRLYPIKFSKFLAFNTNSVANIFFSLAKHIYPRSLVDKVQLGCRVPMTEHDDFPRPFCEIYLQPSLQEANRRLLARARELLLLRAKNEAHFTI